MVVRSSLQAFLEELVGAVGVAVVVGSIGSVCCC